MREKILISMYASWCGLGFIRGVKRYNYNYNHKHNINGKNEPYLYSDSLIGGMSGIIYYANPLLLPFTIHKELYRLEIDIRNLETNKNSKYYNEL